MLKKGIAGLKFYQNVILQLMYGLSVCKLKTITELRVAINAILKVNERQRKGIFEKKPCSMLFHLVGISGPASRSIFPVVSFVIQFNMIW